MDNAEKAAWKIQASCPQGRVLTIDQALVVANVLEEAGLLAPDLPESYREGIFKVSSPHLDVRSVQAAGDQIVLHGYKVRHASIEESRRLALAILAAADYAEKETGQ